MRPGRRTSGTGQGVPLAKTAPYLRRCGWRHGCPPVDRRQVSQHEKSDRDVLGTHKAPLSDIIIRRPDGQKCAHRSSMEGLVEKGNRQDTCNSIQSSSLLTLRLIVHLRNKQSKSCQLRTSKQSHIASPHQLQAIELVVPCIAV